LLPSSFATSAFVSRPHALGSPAEACGTKASAAPTTSNQRTLEF